MKKLFLILTLFLMVMVPQVYALAYENVAVLNNNDSFKGGTPKIVGNGTSNVTITYDAAQLKMVGADRDIGRTIDAAWVGVKVVAPKDVAIDTLRNATYINGSDDTKKSFWNNQDSFKSDQASDEHYINVFGAVTKDILTKAASTGTNIKYTWKFDWNNDNTYDQTVTLIINPEGVVLTAKDTDNVIWNEETYEEYKKDETINEGPKTGDELPLDLGIMFISLISEVYAIKKFKLLESR